MGTTKDIGYTITQNALANMVKAIAHPARLAILEHLLNTQKCMCGDIVEEIGLAQATVSQHLKALKEAGLIKGDIEGRNVCYCIHTENYNALREQLQLFLQPVNEQKCC